jgi:ubiquinone biosynthesis protein UbiJ
MVTTEERLSLVERGIENEQEWRRDMIKEMRAGFDRLEARIDKMESNQRWLIGLLVAILVAIIASNWLG